jgi:hypothetical protein
VAQGKTIRLMTHGSRAGRWLASLLPSGADIRSARRHISRGPDV